MTNIRNKKFFLNIHLNSLNIHLKSLNIHLCSLNIYLRLLNIHLNSLNMQEIRAKYQCLQSRLKLHQIKLKILSRTKIFTIIQTFIRREHRKYRTQMIVNFRYQQSCLLCSRSMKFNIKTHSTRFRLFWSEFDELRDWFNLFRIRNALSFL